MNNEVGLLEEDHAVLWHPCSQMKDYETFKPLHVVGAKGSYLTLKDGRKVIDAVSSWWCKSFGHGHPRLTEALIAQVKKFEHVLLVNTTNDIIVELSQRLVCLCKPSHPHPSPPGGRRENHINKIFYASEGSSAVEIALKMSIHARLIRGQPNKNGIAALSQGYHGETLFALAVSDLGIYRAPYEQVLPKVNFITDLPHTESRFTSLWQDCGEHWSIIETKLDALKDSLSVIIVEPILQGAGGMLIYSKDFLTRLDRWCKLNDVYLIVDEIMTSFGRTGKMFAYEYAGIKPDMVCIGKNLTAGFLPMSAVLLTDEIYQLFYNDYELGQSFLHSHTHSGNALAAAVALENLKMIAEEGVIDQVQALESVLSDCFQEVAQKTKQITNIRYIGGVVAGDIITSNNTDRRGYRVYQAAVKMGAFLRPLGNTLYWLPPLNITTQDVKKLRDITIKAIITTE